MDNQETAQAAGRRNENTVTSSYSCISCRVSFVDGDYQRSHYKSDWHRYNLKRKVAELPPVTKEAFEEKLAQQKVEEEDRDKDTSRQCQMCNKSFSNQNAFANHMKSKKHKLVASKVENAGAAEQTNQNITVESKKTNKAKSNEPTADKIEDIDIDDVDDDDDDDGEWEDVDDEDVESGEEEDEDTEAIPPTNCLFCRHESTSLEENLKHMTRSHSFFIPDIDFVTELENLIIYLGAKVGDGKMCLYCNKKSRTFQTVEAVQKHMRDKSHWKIDYEGESALEYADFYDFSASYPDFEVDNESDDQELEAETGALQVDSDTMELVLPSGARAGHRALKHIYKQSLPPAHLQFRKERAMIKGLNAEYKAIGWHGTVSVATRENMAAHKVKTRHSKKQQLKLGLKANKFQPHLRPQVVF